jgi:hypothetical protein
MLIGVIVGLFILFVGIVSLAAQCNDRGAEVVAWVLIVLLVAIGIAFAYQDDCLAEAEKLRAEETAALRNQIQLLEAKAIAAGVATRVPVKVVETTTFMFNADMVAEASAAAETVETAEEVATAAANVAASTTESGELK